MASSELERRWDAGMDAAWATLRQELADVLAELSEGDLVELQQWQEGAVGAPHVQALVRDGHLRVEAASNAYLGEEWQIVAGQEARLLALGFAEPTGVVDDDVCGTIGRAADYAIAFPLTHVDQAAVLMVRALREVYAVLHPSYLLCEELDLLPGMEDDEHGYDGPRHARPGYDGAAREATGLFDGVDSDDPEETEPIVPGSRGELDEALAGVVGRMIGHEPARDEDGDLYLRTRRALLWLRPGAEGPSVDMFAFLAADLTDESRAVIEANVLSRRHSGYSFFVIGDRLMVTREVSTPVFYPHLVREKVEEMAQQLDHWCEDVVARIGGCGTLEGPQPEPGPAEASEDPRFERASAVLRELERAQRGSVDAATALRIFEGDVDLLLQRIGTESTRIRSLRRSVAELTEAGKQRRAESYRARLRYHEHRRRVLREALRLCVSPPVVSADPARSGRSTPPGRTRPTPRSRAGGDAGRSAS